MGEWSKLVGEKGEEITKFIFEEILNVNSLQENLEIDCVKSSKHKRNNATKGRSTHGLDGLFYLESPVEDELLDIIIVSSKYTDSYPKYPKSDFKAHIKDLAHTLECFKQSKLNNDINQKFTTVTKTEFTGVLVWLSNSDSANYELIPKLSNSILDNDLEFEKIILIDNNRVNFLYETIFQTKDKYDKVDFAYHDSSLNSRSMNKSNYGKKFPINYLYSDLITLRVENDNKVMFKMFVNDNFDPINLTQILSFAKTYDRLNSIFQTQIYYLDYDSLRHEQSVKSVLSNYDNFKLEDNFVLSRFPSDFRN